MNKYDEMSSLELSKEISNIVLLKNWHCKPELNDGNGWAFGDNHGVNGVENEMLDINNLADMWDIILDNNIAISPRISQAGHSDHYKSWVKIDFDCDSYAGGGIWSDDFLVVSHENPLHAAAILFLMMKDSTK